ncbi:tyrosine-type recombinase/integrase [Pseudomonas sp. NPDC087342]|uniref:tyrosine-type recombinase/integrase n=1 Tax=Pseudomonas sp. NPDC087342 TaxID=3364437 RepID=UPI00381A1536
MLKTFLIKELKSCIGDNSFESVVATYYISLEGVHKPLSYFYEMIWRLPDEIFPAGTHDCSKLLDFSKVPLKFVQSVKIAILGFIRGRRGKTPRGKSIVSVYENMLPFLRFVENHTKSLNSINTLIFLNYVHSLKNLPSSTGKPLSPGAIKTRLMAVELLHELTEGSLDAMPKPWPSSSAYLIAGGASVVNAYVKTSRIPDEILASLLKASVILLESADNLLELRAYHHSNLEKNARYLAIPNSLANLKKAGFTGNLQDLKNTVSATLTACIIIILATSGIRSNELLSLKTDCNFSTTEDGETICWIRGEAEGFPRVWIVNKITHNATEIAAKITQDLRDKLALKIRDLEESGSDEYSLISARRNKDSIFLGLDFTGCIQTFSNSAINYRLKDFVQSVNLTWNLASHQFRPTLAHYIVSSGHGDYRYAKEHFGHASLDMLISYTKHGDHDASLLEDVAFAYSEQKQSQVEHFLLETTPLTGGLAEPVQRYRAIIKTYKNWAQMVKSIATNIYIRATSVGWCTNDKGNCIGGEGVEKTRCAKDGGCVNFLADDTHLPAWREIEAQQLELIDLLDIGESGRARAQRDLERSRSVIAQLDPEYRANE